MAANTQRADMVAKPKTSKSSTKAPSKDCGTDLDRLIHERTRLAIVSALAANKYLTFNDLKSLLQVSDGNLSVHARKLEEAGYVICKKKFKGRIPRTEYSLSASGRKALNKYIAHMEALIKTMKNG